MRLFLVFAFFFTVRSLFPARISHPLPSAGVKSGVGFRRLLEPIGLLHEYYEAFRSAGIDSEVMLVLLSLHGVQVTIRERNGLTTVGVP